MRWRFKRLIIKLLKYNNTAPEIALGIAMGVFIAVLPVYGLHTVLVIITALLVRRSNKLAILLGTNISLPPTVPFITWVGYEIGRLIFWGKYPPLLWVDFKKLDLAKLTKLYPPLFLGSVVLGFICAVVFYFLVYFIVVKFKSKKLARKR